MVTEVPPEASDEICDDAGNQDQPRILINIEQNVLSHNLFVSGVRVDHQILK